MGLELTETVTADSPKETANDLEIQAKIFLDNGYFGEADEDQMQFIQFWAKRGWFIQIDESDETWFAEKYAGNLKEAVRVFSGYKSFDEITAAINFSLEPTEDEDEPDEKRRELPRFAVESCRVELTDKDVLMRSSELMKTMNDLDAEKSRFDGEKAIHKQNVELIGANIQKLRNAIDTRQEWRDLQCPLEYDFQRGTVNTIRPDTDEVIKNRSMTKEELQRMLPMAK